MPESCASHWSFGSWLIGGQSRWGVVPERHYEIRSRDKLETPAKSTSTVECLWTASRKTKSKHYHNWFWWSINLVVIWSAFSGLKTTWNITSLVSNCKEHTYSTIKRSDGTLFELYDKDSVASTWMQILLVIQVGKQSSSFKSRSYPLLPFLECCIDFFACFLVTRPFEDFFKAFTTSDLRLHCRCKLFVPNAENACDEFIIKHFHAIERNRILRRETLKRDLQMPCLQSIAQISIYKYISW